MTSILWLTGAAGVGKSVTAWQVFTGPMSEGLGYIDVDQVGMLYPDDETDEYGYSLKNQAIRAIAPNFTAAGARRLLVSGVVDPREPSEAIRLEQAGLQYGLLTVDDKVLRRRLLERGWRESDADEMAAEQAHLSATGHQQKVLARAIRDQQQMDDDGIGDLVIDVDDMNPAASVDATARIITSVA